MADAVDRRRSSGNGKMKMKMSHREFRLLFTRVFVQLHL
ncbi:hypothetical protein AALP_AA6G275400 [Arabis alpina]|uniref:Uncharacterized protein n=1 Tax=Arabis alpina TaxID=50452 RepID=A0A087GS32_ARAAL|nr:hypothetical protein AALP_AA6G275400 [Arabis alpina]